MNKFDFAPMFDVPLVCVTLMAFLLHFNRWALRDDIDTSIDVASRLPAARLRVVSLCLGILLLCWLFNFAVWSIFAVLLGVGVVIEISNGGLAESRAFGLGVAAYLIREWSFGFPELILHPQTHDSDSTSVSDETGELLGKTGVAISPLRPTGNVDIDGVIYSAASADGRLIDAGATVSVTSFRNGQPRVAPVTDSATDG